MSPAKGSVWAWSPYPSDWWPSRLVRIVFALTISKKSNFIFQILLWYNSKMVFKDWNVPTLHHELRHKRPICLFFWLDFFIFLFNSPWSNAYTWVDFIFLKAYDWLTFKDSRWEAGEPTSFQGQWEASISMKSTHVYTFDHGELNRKIKKQKKYQIPEMNAVKPEKTENIKEKSNRPVK